RETVVDGGHEGLVRVDEPPVVPDHRAHGVQSRPLDAIATRRRALSSVSSHSAAGSEPHVMPAPVPKHRTPPSVASHQKVRIATAGSARPASASIQPNAPQYGPRSTGSRASIVRKAEDLGAPETEPGG